jgi:hypothetical protein
MLVVICIVFVLVLKRHKEAFIDEKVNGLAPYTAVLVEPRKHAAVGFVLKNLLSTLPEGTWNILVLHSNGNADWIKEQLALIGPTASKRITLQSMGIDSLTLNEYNAMMKTKEFYERIPTEVFLLIQTDSMVCGPSTDLVNKFLGYDYVGAPWAIHKSVGNGGFSLRKKSKMLEFIDRCSLGENPSENEDLYFSRGCDAMKLNIPSFEEAKEFSIESVYSPKSFGIHKPWNSLNEKMDAVEAHCPGVKELQGLQRVV